MRRRMRKRRKNKDGGEVEFSSLTSSILEVEGERVSCILRRF